MPVFLSFLFLLCPTLLFGQAIPVYLKPNNPAPTGHFDLKELRSTAIEHDQYEWLWVRDDKGHNGWILKASALLPLDFSRRAVLPKGQGVFIRPDSTILANKTLPHSQIVTLMERHRDWYKIIYKENDKNYFGWVPARHLSPYSKDAGYFFSTTETFLRSQPKMKSKVLQRIDPGLPMIPLNTKDSWAYVQFGKVKGYIPFHNLRSRIDIAIKVRTAKGYVKPHQNLYRERVLEIFSNPLWVGTGAYSMDLKAKPDMGSATVTTIAPWNSLALQGYSVKKWGKSNIPRWGELWWPETTLESNVEIIESYQPKMTLLKKSEIYQIEKSPVVPDLYFASATHGVYRSFDSQSWFPLAQFKNGYPIKLAKDGTLFIGDRVSFDHGESFHHFIRWDKVFDSLPYKEKLAKGPIQILNVEPSMNNHKRVTLSLKVGSNNYIQFYSSDLGQNWRLL